jgi:hypothetical protein
MEHRRLLHGVRVWLTEWEWQCCGEDFRVGSEVDWDVMPLQPEEWANLEPLGEELLDTITHYTRPDDHISEGERPQAREWPDFRPASDPDLGGLEGYIVELSEVE